MSEKEVLDTVEEYVNRHQPSAYRLDVSRACEYSDIMEQIEDQIKAQQGLKVLLVPTQPGD